MNIKEFRNQVSIVKAIAKDKSIVKTIENLQTENEELKKVNEELKVELTTLKTNGKK